MTALRRMTWKSLRWAAAALSLAVAMPAAAQDSDAPVDVTAAPPPSAETVGPAQLRDFNLQGTVTRPAQRPADTGARPATPAPAEPAGAAPAASVPTRTAGVGAEASTPRTTQADNAGSTRSGPSPAAEAGPQLATPALPLEVTTDPAPQPGFTDLSTPAEASMTPADLFASWPWLAALIALIGGVAFIAWSRRGRGSRYADPGRLAFAGLAPEAVPEAKPLPPARPHPRPDPVPPRAQPAPSPAPTPVPPHKPADDGLIVSKRLKPQLEVQFVPDRLVVNGSDATLQFDVVITNSGWAPARDVLVEARMFTAHAAQDRDIADFFKAPVGTGDRIPAIVPLGKLSLKSAVRLPVDQLHSFEVQGRKLFVPLVAFNILFRCNGDDDQASASFLVGRGNEQDEKLAPFRIDLGPRVFRGLAARAHSMGLQHA